MRSQIGFQILGFVAAIFLNCSSITNSDEINREPVIDKLFAKPARIEIAGMTSLTCHANDPDGDELSYNWLSEYGSIKGSGKSVSWESEKNMEGIFCIRCVVSDGKGGICADSVSVNVVQSKPTQLFVSAQANIYNLTKTILLPGDGIRPTEFCFANKTGRFITFPEVKGMVDPGYPLVGLCSPDGFEVNQPIYHPAIGNISGIIHYNRSLFMVGVFLAKSNMQNYTSAPLDFSGGGRFSEISPKLNQPFFIGDGVSDTGEIQKFNIPENATRLFLGFVDMDSTGIMMFGDNIGKVTVSVLIHSQNS